MPSHKSYLNLPSKSKDRAFFNRFNIILILNKGPGVFEGYGATQFGGKLPFQLIEMCETYRLIIIRMYLLFTISWKNFNRFFYKAD